MSKRLKLSPTSVTMPASIAVDEDGDLVLQVYTGTKVWFSPEQWQALVAAVEVVDVSTPGERLRQVVGNLPAGIVSPEAWEAAAARLGITEGE